MEKSTSLHPFWNARFHLNRRVRRLWHIFGLSFLLVNVFFVIINLERIARLFQTGTSNTSASKSVALLRRRICHNYLSIGQDGPFTLPCGMSVNAIGRLGNLMGEYATLFALAEINNKPAVILPEMADVLRLYFDISLPTMQPEEQAFWESRWEIHDLHDWMEPRLANLNASFTYLRGFPCSWTFYHHIRDRILQEFRFRDHILKDTYQTLNKIRRGRESVTFVGVHNRRSDYVKLMASEYRGVVADAAFFQEAFHYFESKYPDAVFLVVSDDMKWCQQNMNNSKGNVYFVGNNNQKEPVYDLALMANCNHSIITIGTFGYWGAYLAGGDTVYLTNYTLPDSPFMEVLKYDKFYLPEWKPIAANLSAFKEPKTGICVPCFLAVVACIFLVLGFLAVAHKMSSMANSKQFFAFRK